MYFIILSLFESQNLLHIFISLLILRKYHDLPYYTLKYFENFFWWHIFLLYKIGLVQPEISSWADPASNCNLVQPNLKFEAGLAQHWNPSILPLGF